MEIEEILKNYKIRILRQINWSNYDKYAVDSKEDHTLYENFTHIEPFGFRINNSEFIEVRTY